MKISKKVRNAMPGFFKVIDADILVVYDVDGTPKGMTMEQKEKVEWIKKELKSEVVAIVESSNLFPMETEPTHMTSYILKADSPWIIEDNVVGFMAWVVNDSWNIEESGSMGLTEYKDGKIERIM